MWGERVSGHMTGIRATWSFIITRSKKEEEGEEGTQEEGGQGVRNREERGRKRRRTMQEQTYT